MFFFSLVSIDGRPRSAIGAGVHRGDRSEHLTPVEGSEVPREAVVLKETDAGTTVAVRCFDGAHLPTKYEGQILEEVRAVPGRRLAGQKRTSARTFVSSETRSGALDWFVGYLCLESEGASNTPQRMLAPETKTWDALEGVPCRGGSFPAGPPMSYSLV